MKVEFEKIICEDTFAFEYLEFDFISGIHSIVGVNGASKTSILLALAQGLFNRNPKGVKIDDVSNTITGKPYQITIFFKKGGDKYKVINSRKTGSITVTVNGKNLSRKTIPQNLELIREIIGDAYDTFINATYQASNSTLDLLEESSDAARKAFINKVLKFDELDELLAFSKDKLKRIKALYKDKLDQQKHWQGMILPMREVGVLKCVKELEVGVTYCENEKTAADWYRSEMSVARVEEAAKHKAYLQYQAGLAKLEESKRVLDTLPIPDRSEREVEQELAETKEKLTRVRAIIDTAQNKLFSLEEPELVCSRCGHELDGQQALDLYNADKLSLETQISEATVEKKYLLELLSVLSDYARGWAAIEVATLKLEQETKALVEVEVSDAAIYSTACAAYDKANKAYQDAVEFHTTAVQMLNDAIRHNDLVAMIIKINKEATEANKQAVARLKAINLELADIEIRMDLLDNWVRVLGPNGYRVHSMSRFLGVLNQTMDKYSSIISGGKIKCSFFVTSEGKIDFSVVDPDKKIPFANWSAGEQARVKLACLFAVIELLEVMGSASYNVLVLDEIFSALDEEGKEGLFEVLSFLRANGKCIYTISHTPLVNPVVFDSAIQVVKQNGLARIV